MPGSAIRSQGFVIGTLLLGNSHIHAYGVQKPKAQLPYVNRRSALRTKGRRRPGRPLRLGGGTRLKWVHAMIFRCAVMSLNPKARVQVP